MDIRDQAMRLTVGNPELCAEIVKLMATQRRGRPAMQVGMTRKMHELLSFIRDFSAANDGVCPSFDEMKDAVDLRSKSGVHRLVTALEERGLISRLKNRARAMVVNDSELIRSHPAE